MSTFAQTMRKVIRRGGDAVPESARAVDDRVATAALPADFPVVPPVEIAPNDALVAYLQSVGGAIEVDRLELDSPAVTALREAGVALVVPLVSGGELVGTLNLGPRLSDQQ